MDAQTEKVNGWNYRIFRHPPVPIEGIETGCTYAIHEAFYNEAGEVNGWTKEPISGHFESVLELIESHGLMTADAIKYRNKVLDYESRTTAQEVDSEIHASEIDNEG